MPPEIGQEQFIPQWAASLSVAVARVEARTDEIPTIIQELKDLKANTVTNDMHMRLRQDVEMLKEHDFEGRSDWEEMKQRVPLLWDERSQVKGAIRFVQVWAAIVTFLVVVLGLFIAAHNAGIHLST